MNKIVIISDIRGKSESIIPYGLKLARHLESEVDILHVIDPRSEPVLPSSFADSQSFAIGEKFSYNDTLQREKSRADSGIDKLLSTEASKLNYPLKIHTVIEEGSIEDKISDYLDSEQSVVFLINSQPDGHLFKSQKEMMDIVTSTGAIFLIIPSGYTFRVFSKVVLLLDFMISEINEFGKVSFVLKQFTPVYYVLKILKSNETAVMDQETREMEKEVTDLLKPFASEVIHLATNHNRFIALLNDNNPDLLVMFQKKPNLYTTLFGKSLSLEILEHSVRPVLIYSINN